MLKTNLTPTELDDKVSKQKNMSGPLPNRILLRAPHLPQRVPNLPRPQKHHVLRAINFHSPRPVQRSFFAHFLGTYILNPGDQLR
jgi:hypothetical protein